MEAWPVALLLQGEISTVWLWDLVSNKEILHSELQSNINNM